MVQTKAELAEARQEAQQMQSEAEHAMESAHEELLARAEAEQRVLESSEASDLPCDTRSEGGQSLVIRMTSLVALEGGEGNPL